MSERSMAGRAPRSCSTSPAPPPTRRLAPAGIRRPLPGPGAHAASCPDGHALALRGEAGRAIGIATSGAFSGTLFGVLCLAAFTPLLAEVSLSFGAYEFFWLALLGVAMSGSIVGNDPLKGRLMGTLGLFAAQIGHERPFAHDRFTFGWSQLSGGIS